MSLYLSESKRLKMLTLCALYVAQGVPFGFATIAFAAWLAQPQHNLTTEQLGPILGVATLPWGFKFVWGPFMDRFTIPSLGRRRPWIIFAQAMAIIVLGSLAFFDDLPGMVWTEPPQGSQLWASIFWLVPGPLAAMILVANVFVSMQDVAVDALAVDLLKEEERGVANGLMYGSSYLGTAIGGAGLGFLIANFGIKAGLFGQAAILFVIMLLPIVLRERRAPEQSSESPTDAQTLAPAVEATVPDFGNPYAVQTAGTEAATTAVAAANNNHDGSSMTMNLLRAFTVRSSLLGVVLAIGVKIGIGVLTAVFVNYLLKDGGWSQDDYTSVTGGYAVMVGLTGAALGGFLADRWGAKPMIASTSILLGIIWIVFGLFPSALASKNCVVALLIAQEFILAVLSVALFSLFMTVSWPRVAATQFTTYMALMNLSTTIGSYTAGKVSDSFSIYQILMLAGVLQIVMIFPVLFIDPGQSRRVLGDA